MKKISLSLFVLLMTGCGGVNISISIGQPSPTPTFVPTATVDAGATATTQAQAIAAAQAGTATAQAVTATAQAQATAAAQNTAVAQAQATNAAQSTATAQARSTASAQQTAAVVATSQAFAAYASTLAQSGKLSYGPAEGVLDKPVDPLLIKTLSSGVYLRNLVVDAVFTNPADGTVHPWDYGFLFRRTPAGKCAAGYRFYLSSDQSDRLVLATGKTLPDQTCEAKEIYRGKVAGLNVAVNGTNSVRLVVQDKLAFFFLNNVYQTLFDVSELGEQGDVIIGSALEVAHNFPGLATPFKNFSVYSLP